jgi:hypothetical protein
MHILQPSLSAGDIPRGEGPVGGLLPCRELGPQAHSARSARLWPHQRERRVRRRSWRSTEDLPDRDRQAGYRSDRKRRASVRPPAGRAPRPVGESHREPNPGPAQDSGPVLPLVWPTEPDTALHSAAHPTHPSFAQFTSHDGSSSLVRFGQSAQSSAGAACSVFDRRRHQLRCPYESKGAHARLRALRQANRIRKARGSVTAACGGRGATTGADLVHGERRAAGDRRPLSTWSALTIEQKEEAAEDQLRHMAMPRFLTVLHLSALRTGRPERKEGQWPKKRSSSPAKLPASYAS